MSFTSLVFIITLYFVAAAAAAAGDATAAGPAPNNKNVMRPVLKGNVQRPMIMPSSFPLALMTKYMI